MCSSNSAHRFRRWIIIEKNTAATIDLEVDEAGRKHGTGRHNFGWPVTRSLITRGDALNHPTIDQEDRMIMPSISIENTVSRNCQLGSSGVFGWFQTHRLNFLTGRLVGPSVRWPNCTMHRLGVRYAIMRAELRELANVPEGAATEHHHFRE
jgi:hypothetical protein